MKRLALILLISLTTICSYADTVVAYAIEGGKMYPNSNTYEELKIESPIQITFTNSTITIYANKTVIINVYNASNQHKNSSGNMQVTYDGYLNGDKVFVRIVERPDLSTPVQLYIHHSNGSSIVYNLVIINI